VNSVETYKVTLTVVQPMEIIGFVEDESEEKMLENLVPKLIERWGEDNFEISLVELADEDEIEALVGALADKKKELN